MENKRKWMVIATLTLMLLLCTAWLMGAFDDGTSAQMAKVRDMQKQIEDNKDLTREQRWEQFRNLRKEIDQLPADQRSQVGMGRNFARQMNKQLDHYFELTPEQRMAELDKQIRQMEEWRKKWEAREAERGAASNAQANSSGAGQGGDKNGAGQTGDSSAGKNKDQDSRRDNWRNMDPQQRRQSMLDSTSADQRAKMAQYRMDMNNRRAQLNLPPMQGPGGFGRGGFGRSR